MHGCFLTTVLPSIHPFSSTYPITTVSNEIITSFGWLVGWLVGWFVVCMFMNDAWKIRNTLTYQMTIRLTNVPLKSDLTLTFKLILTVFFFF